MHELARGKRRLRAAYVGPARPRPPFSLEIARLASYIRNNPEQIRRNLNGYAPRRTDDAKEAFSRPICPNNADDPLKQYLPSVVLGALR
jgi:hypothetical protein